MDTTHLAVALDLDASASLDEILTAYRSEVDRLEKEIAAERNKTERVMLKQSLKQLKETHAPVLEPFEIRIKLEGLLAEISNELSRGSGGLSAYFQDVDRYLPGCDDEGLRRKLESMREAAKMRGRLGSEGAPEAQKEHSERRAVDPIPEEPSSTKGVPTPGDAGIPVDKPSKKKPCEVAFPPEETVPVLGKWIRIVIDGTRWILTCDATVFFLREFDEKGSKPREAVALMEDSLDFEAEIFRKMKYEVSWKHFHLVLESNGLVLVDGFFKENGVQRHSTAGIYIDGERVYIQQLKRMQGEPVLTVRWPGVVKGYPAYRLRWMNSPSLDSASLKCSSGSAIPFMQERVLLMNRIDGVAHHVVVGHAPFAGDIFGAPFTGYTFIPTVDGFCLRDPQGSFIDQAQFDSAFDAFIDESRP